MTANGACKPDVIHNAGYTKPEEKTMWTSVIRHENLTSRALSISHKHLSCLYLQMCFTFFTIAIIIMGDTISPLAFSMVKDLIIGDHKAE